MALWAKRDDMIVHEIEPYNAEPPRTALAGRFLTPVEAFFARNHGPIPDLDPDTWRLELDGLLERPATLTLKGLRTGFPHRELVVTVQCAGNRRAGLAAVRPIPGEALWDAGAISTARWTGVSLADVLAWAGPLPGAAHIEFTGADVAPLVRPPQQFGGSIPIAKATAGEVMLAWEMNGRPLPRPHGAPVRVIVPGYIGARSVKWVTRVTARERPSANHFQARAYRLLPRNTDPARVLPGEGVALGPVAVVADILRPGDGAILPAGTTMVSGYACGGHGRDVARVEVSADDGRTWWRAHLDPGAGPWAWRLWHATAELPPGEHSILARACDTAADCQPESPEALWNPGGYVNNAWARVRVRTS